LQTRTGIKGKPFEKIKFAVVQKSNYSKPMYLEDGMSPINVCRLYKLLTCFSTEDIIYDISDEGECLLGLDHVDRNGRNGWGRAGGPEIRIK
jgi:ubiquitin carboxyl-terminal hydrolase 7